MAEKSEFKQRPMLVVLAQSVALVAALFVVVLSVLMVADHVRLLKMDPLNDPTLLELREKLGDSTEKDEALVEQIRTYDLYARRAFFSNQEQRTMGGLLILGGAVACFVTLKLSKRWKPELPSVGKSGNPDHWELNNLFRQLMAGMGIFLVVVSLFLAFATQSDLAVVLAQPQQGRQVADDTATVPQASSLPRRTRFSRPTTLHHKVVCAIWIVLSGLAKLVKRISTHGGTGSTPSAARVTRSGAFEESDRRKWQTEPSKPQPPRSEP